VAFTIKTRAVDVDDDESHVYHELLCFSSNAQCEWPSAEEVYAISQLHCFISILLRAIIVSQLLIAELDTIYNIFKNL
jgi:hypothetical protein